MSADRDSKGRFVRGNKAAIKVDPNEPQVVKDFQKFAEAKAKELYARDGELPTMRSATPGLPDLKFGSVLDMQRSMVRTVNNILYSDSIARRKEPMLHRMMLKDPDVFMPLFIRTSVASRLDWSIEAEDELDETQKEQAVVLETLIRRYMRLGNDMLRHLARAVYFGPAAANVHYGRVRYRVRADDESEPIEGEGIAPRSWKPLHSDSLQFDIHGELHLSTNVVAKGAKKIGPMGYVRELTPNERRAVVLHVYNREAPDYEEYFEARKIFAGSGMRDVVFYPWMMKQSALQIWMAWIEQFGLGIREFRYPDSDQGGQSATIKYAKNLDAENNTIVLPGDPSNEWNGYSFQLHTMDTGAPQVFTTIINDFLSGQIRFVFLGQTATTEETHTGLGSSVGDHHARTFDKLVANDMELLQDSLNYEFLDMLHVMNYGDTPWRPKWRYALEEFDAKEYMETVEKYVGIGGRVSVNDVAPKVGIRVPRPDEEVLEGRDPMGGMGLTDDLFGQEGDNERSDDE